MSIGLAPDGKTLLWYAGDWAHTWDGYHFNLLMIDPKSGSVTLDKPPAKDRSITISYDVFCPADVPIRTGLKRGDIPIADSVAVHTLRAMSNLLHNAIDLWVKRSLINWSEEGRCHANHVTRQLCALKLAYLGRSDPQALIRSWGGPRADRLRER